MSRASRAAALKARRRHLREELRRRRPPRRRWVWAALLVLALVAALWCCGCPADPLPPEVGAPEALGLGVDVERPALEVPLPRLERRDRPNYENEAPEPLAWLDAYRLQVAARSPRLAECFVGAEQPGALKWTAAVEATSGKVSDHVLEPTLDTAALTQEQRECVLGVLSDPPYRLSTEHRSTPSRVSIAIEF